MKFVLMNIKHSFIVSW